MKKSKKVKNWKTILLVLSLATLCVGGAELFVCSIADPALYNRIVAPVRGLCAEMESRISAMALALAERPTPSPTPDPAFESQLAGEPALWPSGPATDPAITELTERDSLSVLTGGSVEVVFYNQGAPEWRDKPYGRDNIGKYGCGPTAMAMAVSSMTETVVSPEEMAVWAAENGYWVPGSGSRLSIIEGAAQAYGLHAEPLRDFTPDALLQELVADKLLVALVSKGHFTTGGHFILVRGATLDGSFLVADPNSLDRSLIVWNPQLILDELSPSRTSGAPLWILSRPDPLSAP